MAMIISSFVPSSVLPSSKRTLVPLFPNSITNDKLVPISSKLSHPPLFPALAVDHREHGDAMIFPITRLFGKLGGLDVNDPIPMTVFDKGGFGEEEDDAGLFPIPMTVFGKGGMNVEEGDAGLFPIPMTVFGKGGDQDVEKGDHARLVPIPRTIFG
nr:LLDR protein Lu11-26217 [Linum usitatissimum]FAA04161.1 TPA: flax LLDR protein Lu11-26217 [Linum usitatissimum]